MHKLSIIGLAAALLGLPGCVQEDVSTKPGNPQGKPAAGKPAAGKPAAGKPAEEKPPEEKPAADPSKSPKEKGDWVDGDSIASGTPGVANLQILKVHKNGTGEVCGIGKTATLRYKAMLANGNVIDPGTRPFTFPVGSGRAIKGWDVIVAKMRVGDSFTITIPQQLAYGPSKGDLKFDMELLSFR